MHPVLRRYNGNEPVQIGTGRDNRSNCGPPTTPWIQDKLGQECAGSFPGNTVPRVGGELYQDDHIITRRQVARIGRSMSGCKQQVPHISSRTCEVDRQDDCNSNGSPPRTTVLQEPSATEEPCPDHLSLL